MLPDNLLNSYSLHIQCRATDKDYKKHTYPVLLPCWSLAALLKLIPIIDENSYQLVGTLDGGAICKHPCTCIMYQEKEPIDAVFNMIVWLKESKHI